MKQNHRLWTCQFHCLLKCDVLKILTIIYGGRSVLQILKSKWCSFTKFQSRFSLTVWQSTKTNPTYSFEIYRHNQVSTDRRTAWGCRTATRVPQWNTAVYWKIICKLSVLLLIRVFLKKGVLMGRVTTVNINN